MNAQFEIVNRGVVFHTQKASTYILFSALRKNHAVFCVIFSNFVSVHAHYFRNDRCLHIVHGHATPLKIDICLFLEHANHLQWSDKNEQKIRKLILFE